MGLCRPTLSYPFCIPKPVQVIRTTSTPLLWTTRSHNVDHRASSKLLADAEHEEQTAVTPTPTSIHHGTTSEHPNWTGEESVEDAVLRMLVDKYKPLRTGTIRTAEEKMHHDASPIPSSSRLHVYQADEPLLPAVEGHKPWHTKFKVPSHATASIRYGHIPTVATASSSTSSTRRAAQVGPTDDDRTRHKEREVKKRSEIVGRLTRAKESTLDYRLGITKNIKSGVQVRPNPVSVKGWAGLVEARIEQARQEGHFRTIKGRGKPLERGNEEHNPFLAREEFLMNRIVQRQGAAPPWVEIQRELEAAVDTFRSVLKQSWVRRAVRMLTLSGQPLRDLSLADARALRDREWEAREKAYHESALAEVNALVRKYNALAPYAVRRVYYVRDIELDRAYEDGAEAIVQELAGRYRASRAEAGITEDDGKARDEDERTVMSVQSQENTLRFRDIFWQWFRGRRSCR